MPTESDINDAVNAGASCAKEALAQSTKPLLIMDEYCHDELSTAFAIGWNSIWASDENRRRWESHPETDEGREAKTPPQVVSSLVKLMSTVDDHQMWSDRLAEVITHGDQ